MISPSSPATRPMTRRQLLGSGIALGTLLIAACAQAPASGPAPTSAPAPAAPATTAPAPTSAPAPAAPTATTAPAPAAPAPTATTAAQPTPAAAATAKPVAGAPVVPLFRSSANEIPFINDDLALFKKNHPDITVNPVFVPGNQYNQKIDLMVASGDPPSLWFPASDRGFKYYSAKGLIMDLDPFVQRDNFDINDFFPRGVDGSKWKGKLNAIPISEWAWVLFYNKTLFDKAKVAPPPKDWKDASWTWDKYLETAKALTVTSNGRTTQFGTNIPEGRGFFTGWTHGGWWFNKDWTTTGWITKYSPDPAVTESIQYWADATNKLKVAPSAADEQTVQAGTPNLLMSGKVAMYLDSIGSLSELSKIKEFEWDMAARPHPTKGESHTGIWVDWWSMFKDVRNPDGSWELMKHMVSPEGEKIYPVSYGPIASRVSLGTAWSTTWTQKINKSPESLQLAVDAVPLEFVTPDNFSVNFSPINDQAIQPELDKVFLGKESAADAIKAITANAEKVIADTTKGAS